MRIGYSCKKRAKALNLLKYNAVKTFQARVFNRWGKLLYSWDLVSGGWDGTFNGEKMSDGTYFFIINGTDLKDQPFEEKGTVTLLGN
jgi:gliding motility-associated-like protein